MRSVFAVVSIWFLALELIFAASCARPGWSCSPSPCDQTLSALGSERTATDQDGPSRIESAPFRDLQQYLLPHVLKYLPVNPASGVKLPLPPILPVRPITSIPPEQAKIWHFVFRTALLPRAPTVA